ncbi:MAG: GNAT family N-acetyltransferase [bacterium]|nr:GNAT family N-acetyltransferase [bacterium]
MKSATTLGVSRIDRQSLQPWLPTLDEWLLPGCHFSVHHTWPLLYRSDGRGNFFAIFEDDRLVSHCATREVDLVTAVGSVRATLLGSVATAPSHRGRGLAHEVLQAAITASREVADHILLWAERAELYEQVGFGPRPTERCIVLARRPTREIPDDVLVRPLEMRDHTDVHELHCRKPWRVDRSPIETSGLLTTPGLVTLVAERDGTVVAYACCGKGADLTNHWHEVGGEDRDIATVIQRGLHHCDQIEAAFLLPPNRPALTDALGRSIIGEFETLGPMASSRQGEVLPPCWIDGLDSV